MRRMLNIDNKKNNPGFSSVYCGHLPNYATLYGRTVLTKLIKKRQIAQLSVAMKKESQQSSNANIQQIPLVAGSAAMMKETLGQPEGSRVVRPSLQVIKYTNKPFKF